MSIQMITMLDLDDTLITFSLEARSTLLKNVYKFDNRFNNTEIDKYISIFHNIRDIYNFEIEF